MCGEKKDPEKEAIFQLQKLLCSISKKSKANLLE